MLDSPGDFRIVHVPILLSPHVQCLNARCPHFSSGSYVHVHYFVPRDVHYFQVRDSSVAKLGLFTKTLSMLVGPKGKGAFKQVQ